MRKVMKIVKPEITMKPVTGTFREALHLALDDVMNDVESQTESFVGGMIELHAEKDGYRHRLTLSVSIVTEPLGNPELN